MNAKTRIAAIAAAVGLGLTTLIGVGAVSAAPTHTSSLSASPQIIPPLVVSVDSPNADPGDHGVLFTADRNADGPMPQFILHATLDQA